jgi:hypothetical protein
VHFEEIGVIGGNVDALFEDVFLDAVVVELYVLGVVDISHVNQEIAPFHRTHGIPELLEVVALENPLVHHEKLEYFGNLLAPLQRLPHFLCVLLMLLPHQRRKPLIGLDGNCAFDSTYLQPPFRLRYAKRGLHHSALRYIFTPEIDHLSLHFSPNEWISVRGTCMVDGEVFIFEIKGRGNYDDSDHHIYWHCVADDSPISFHFVHHSQSHQHEQSGSSSDTVDPSRKRLQITRIDDGRPDNSHWQLSFPLLY